MKFSASFEKIQVDVVSYQRALDKTLREALAHGMYEYLNAVLSVIPVWSGASRATFLQLARTISMSIPISPVAWTNSSKNKNNANGLNRISLGERCGTGKLIINSAKGEYAFEYTNDLHYLTYNEEHNANTERGDPKVFSTLKNPGPYHFQAKGAAAFVDAVKETRLPSPWNYIKRTRLRVGPRTIY